MSEQLASDVAGNPALTNLMLIALFVQFTRLLPLLRSALPKLDALLKHFGITVVDGNPSSPAPAPAAAAPSSPAK